MCFCTLHPRSYDSVWELCIFLDLWISGAAEREITFGNRPLSEVPPSDKIWRSTGDAEIDGTAE